jgi:Rrf2 family nitric oxide-sensitive transcriptional repressor
MKKTDLASVIPLKATKIDSHVSSAHTGHKRSGMQLSRFTDYSLRVLLYVAINDGRRSTLHEIAEFYPISVEHLRKVVHELSRSGYINTYQGKNGGMDLAKAPRSIAIGEVIKHFEGHSSFIDCDRLSCKLASVCTLKSVLMVGQEALYDKLNEYSLADLLESKPKMVKVLANPL